MKYPNKHFTICAYLHLVGIFSFNFICILLYFWDTLELRLKHIIIFYGILKVK